MRYFHFFLSTILILILTSCSFSEKINKPNKPWSYNPNEEALHEKRMYHVTKEEHSVYLLGDGEGYSKMLILSPSGKKVWEKELKTPFAIGINRIPALYTIENGKINKYNLNTGRKLRTIKLPVKVKSATELYGISHKNTLYFFDWDIMQIVEINENGNKVSSMEYSQEALEKLTVQKPNMQNSFREPPENISQSLNQSIVPSFIKRKETFELKYGKGAKYYPSYISKKHESKIYILANYQINGTKSNIDISSHCVLFIFSINGQYLSQTDLGDYNGTDIDLSSKGLIYVSLNNLQNSVPYAIVQTLDKNNIVIKEFKLSNQYIIDGKLHNDHLFIVTDKQFYYYPEKELETAK